MNDLLDTRKCVYSQQIYFNILHAQEFIGFIDHEDMHSNTLEIIKDEQQMRIQKIVNESKERIGL